MGRIAAVASAASANAISGSGTANQVAYFSGTGTITGSTALTVALASAAGTANSMTLTHPDNTATASHAYLELAVGGTTSTGDPHVRFTVPGGTNWYVGSDNSDSDALKIGTGTVVGTNTQMSFATGIIRFGATSVRVGLGAAAATQCTFFHETVNTGSIQIAGGFNVDTGGVIEVFGGAHATLANVARLKSAGTVGATVLSGGKLIANVGLGVGNFASATVGVGLLANKVEIFDTAGASLGFLPVYATIT